MWGGWETLRRGATRQKGGREMLLTALSSMGPRVLQPRDHTFVHIRSLRAGWRVCWWSRPRFTWGGMGVWMHIESNVEAFWKRHAKTQLIRLIELAAIALAIELFAVCLRDAHVLVFVDTECVRKHLVKIYSLDIDFREVAGRLLTVTRRDW